MSEVIVQGIDWWLREEVRESNAGRNVVLDDFSGMRESYLQNSGSNSMDAAKITSHFGRFNLLVNNVDAEGLQRDFVAGKIIHHALMFVSGGFRTQCFLQAANQAEYEVLRFGRNSEPNGAAGVWIKDAVEATLGKDYVATPPQTLNIAQVLEESSKVNERIFENQLGIYGWLKSHPDHARSGLQEDSYPVELALDSQKAGLVLAISHIAVAASLREGKLSRVPVLEPKSISDVSSQPIYPFAA